MDRHFIGALLVAVLTLGTVWSAEAADGNAGRDDGAKSTRQPVPAPAAQAASRQVIKDVFKEQYSAAAAGNRRALGLALLKEAGQTSNDPTARFVLLSEARDAATAAADVETAVRAIEEMDGSYTLPPASGVVPSLTAVGRVAVRPSDFVLLTEALCRACDRAIDADELLQAARAVSQGDAMARRANSPGPAEQVRFRQQAIRDLGPELARATAAKAKLARNPGDAESSTVAGRYAALAKGDWAGGLALLASGSDAELKGLARRELDAPSKVEEQADLADAWWALAQKQNRWSKAVVERHAADWYRKAAPQLPQGLKRKQAEARVAAAMATTGDGTQLVYTFEDRAALDDFDVVGRATLVAGGGLELNKGTPAAATTKAVFVLPIRVEFDAYCAPGGVLDMAPRICSDPPGSSKRGFGLLMGNSFNTVTSVLFFGSETKLTHHPLKANEPHRIVLSIDAARHAEATFDGEVLFAGDVPADAKVEGHVVLNGGRGDVVYKRVVITAKRAEK